MMRVNNEQTNSSIPTEDGDIKIQTQFVLKGGGGASVRATTQSNDPCRKVVLNTTPSIFFFLIPRLT